VQYISQERFLFFELIVLHIRSLCCFVSDYELPYEKHRSPATVATTCQSDAGPRLDGLYIRRIHLVSLDGNGGILCAVVSFPSLGVRIRDLKHT